MTQHLWVAWGPRYEVGCHKAEMAWNPDLTTEKLSQYVLWQGFGAKCGLCSIKAKRVAKALQAAVEICEMCQGDRYVEPIGGYDSEDRGDPCPRCNKGGGS